VSKSLEVKTDEFLWDQDARINPELKALWRKAIVNTGIEVCTRHNESISLMILARILIRNLISATVVQLSGRFLHLKFCNTGPRHSDLNNRPILAGDQYLKTSDSYLMLGRSHDSQRESHIEAISFGFLNLWTLFENYGLF